MEHHRLAAIGRKLVQRLRDPFALDQRLPLRRNDGLVGRSGGGLALRPAAGRAAVHEMDVAGDRQRPGAHR